MSILHRLCNFISNHPVFGVVGVAGSLASVIGVPLAFYLTGINSPKVIFLKEAPRMVASNSVPGMTVTFNGKPLDQPVYTSKVFLANIGRQSVKPDMLNEPVSILFPGEATLLDARIGHQTARFVKAKTSIDGNKVLLKWDVLPDRGCFIVDLVWSEDPKLRTSEVFKVEGNIDGQGRIHESSRTEGTSQTMLFGVLGFGVIFLIVGALDIFYLNANNRWPNKLPGCVMLAGALVLVWSSGYLLILPAIPI